MTSLAKATVGQAAQPTEFSHGLEGAGLPLTGVEPRSWAQMDIPVSAAIYWRASSEGRGSVFRRIGMTSSRKPSAANSLACNCNSFMIRLRYFIASTDYVNHECDGRAHRRMRCICTCGNAHLLSLHEIRLSTGMKQETSLMQVFRRDRLVGVWLALLLLLSPYLQPMSEAMAAGKPFAAEICTSFGASDKASAPVAADDCPDCIAGSHAAIKAFLPGDWNARDAYSGAATASYLVSDRDEPGIISKRWLAPPGHAPPSAELI